jgi:Domain of unknown function (DUF4385)
MPFDYSIDFSLIDFRKHPEGYHIGRGEQWVLLVQPYKDELLPHWRFRTPMEACNQQMHCVGCSKSTVAPATLSEWIWRENTYKWDLRDPEDTPTTNLDANTRRKQEKGCRVGSIRKRLYR